MLLPLLWLTVGCHGVDGGGTGEGSQQWRYANLFGASVMSSFYLWNKEVADAIDSWSYSDDPIEKVQQVRYKDDRWSMMTDDIESFLSAVNGTGKTFGFDYVLYLLEDNSVQMVVAYTFDGSPAEKAGLVRGDVITMLNNQQMTFDNYVEVLTAAFSSDEMTLTDAGSRNISLSAVQMYEDPIQTVKTFSHAGRNIGYLHYTGFTPRSGEDLPAVARQFKNAGVQDVILDLRYNGGGYVLTEQVLAALLAQEGEVLAGSIYSTEVYNSDVAAEVEDNTVRFSTSINISSVADSPQVVDVSDAILSPEHIYFIVSEGTASASESLIGCLAPYGDVTVVGKQTHGKFCSGIVLEAPSWYRSLGSQISPREMNLAVQATASWGIYVMISRFADKDGYTRCAPSGIVPDFDADDDPRDQVALGDPSEPMLAAVLALIDGDQSQAVRRPSARRSSFRLLPKPEPSLPGRFAFGAIPF